MGADEAVAGALAASRWDASFVTAALRTDTPAWLAAHGLATLSDGAFATAFQPCALCPERRGAIAVLTCGHALCIECAAFSADAQSPVHLCAHAAIDVAICRIACPATDAGSTGCKGFMARASAATFRSDDVRIALDTPLRAAPLAAGPYVRCVACPQLLLAPAQGCTTLRCACGHYTCSARGGVDACAGRAHAPLSCAAAARLEEVLAAWEPRLRAARDRGVVEAENLIALALPALPRLHALDDVIGDDERRLVDDFALRPRRPRGPPLAADVAAAPAPPAVAPGEPPTLRPDQAIWLRLASAAAAVLSGCAAADDVAAVPADAVEALRWADALCAPLLTGLARRRAAAPGNARDAAVLARDAAQRALEAADSAAAKARAAAAPGGAGNDAAATAAGDAADAAANANAAAASARTSAATAADAVLRLTSTTEPAPVFADAAAAAANEAADVAEMLASAAGGHAAAAAAALGGSACDAAGGGPGGGGAAAMSAAYLRRETRPCPGCGVPTIKVEGGCNAMHPCTKCARTWCWSCLGPVHECVPRSFVCCCCHGGTPAHFGCVLMFRLCRHSFGPCSLAGNRAAIEAAVAAAAPDAAEQAAAQAAAMAAADARVAERRTGAAPRRVIAPRAAQPRDAEIVPPDEAELAPLAMAADSLRAVITAADADVIARPLRLLRALLAAVVRAAATERGGRLGLPRLDEVVREADGLRRIAEDRDRAIRELRLAARRALAGRAFGEPLTLENHPAVDVMILNQAVQAADAPLLAAARDAAAALAAAHGDDVAVLRDVDAAAAAWASLFEARRREQAARDAAMPGGVAEAGAEPSTAWSAACRALAAAAAADARCQLVRLAAALRIADVAPAAAADDVAAVRNAAARCEASALALALACGHRGGYEAWPPPRAGTDGANNAYHLGILVPADVAAAAAAASADAAVLQLLVDALWMA